MANTTNQNGSPTTKPKVERKPVPLPDFTVGVADFDVPHTGGAKAQPNPFLAAVDEAIAHKGELNEDGKTFKAYTITNITDERTATKVITLLQRAANLKDHSVRAKWVQKHPKTGKAANVVVFRAVDRITRTPAEKTSDAGANTSA